MRSTSAASPSVSNAGSDGSTRSPNDDMIHQDYTHVISPASPVFIGVPDHLTPDDTSRHQQTSVDNRRTTLCDRSHISSSVPINGTRSAAEDLKRCACAITRNSIEFVPHSMLAAQQFLAGTNPAAIFRSQLRLERKRIADE